MIARRDIANARRLFAFRLRSSWLWGVVVYAIIALVVLANGLRWLTGTSDTNSSGSLLYVYDYSLLLSALVPYALFILMNWQPKVVENAQMFPQSTTSRFLAEQAFYYLVIALIVLGAMVLHLFQQILATAMASRATDIYIAYSFDAGFLLSTAAVFFVTLSVITATFSLIAAFIRAAKLNLSIPLVVVSVFLFMAALYAFPSSLIIRLQELSLNMWLFLAAGLLITLAFFILALMLSKTFVVVSESKTSNWARYTATAFLLFAMLFASLGTRVTLPYQPDNVLPPDQVEIVIDATELPAGSNIIVENPMLRIYEGPDLWWETSVFSLQLSETPGLVMGDFFDGELFGVTPSDGNLEAIEDSIPTPFVGSQVTINYHPARFSLNNPELLDAVNPQITATLEGNILRIGYDYQRGNTIVYLPMWQMMQVFGIQSEHLQINEDAADHVFIPGFETTVLTVSGD